MRENYETLGVENYYYEVSSSYRNPHFEGIKKALHLFMDHFWTARLKQLPQDTSLVCLDMAAGSGEVTESIQTWIDARWPQESAPIKSNPRVVRPLRQATSHRLASLPRPERTIVATDPYTAAAYHSRIGQADCLNLSFQDIADGKLPEIPHIYDIAFCSFALHLIGASELWAVLSELSRRARFLCVLAPHKLPMIKDEWGFVRMDAIQDPSQIHIQRGDGKELIIDRVRLRLYRSSSLD